VKYYLPSVAVAAVGIVFLWIALGTDEPMRAAIARQRWGLDGRRSLEQATRRQRVVGVVCGLLAIGIAIWFQLLPREYPITFNLTGRSKQVEVTYSTSHSGTRTLTMRLPPTTARIGKEAASGDDVKIELRPIHGVTEPLACSITYRGRTLTTAIATATDEPVTCEATVP